MLNFAQATYRVVSGCWVAVAGAGMKACWMLVGAFPKRCIGAGFWIGHYSLHPYRLGQIAGRKVAARHFATGCGRRPGTIWARGLKHGPR